jgi:hypothetical protein
MLMEQKMILKEKEMKEHKLVRRRIVKMSKSDKYSLVNEYLKPIINYVSAKKYTIPTNKRSHTFYERSKDADDSYFVLGNNVV